MDSNDAWDRQVNELCQRLAEARRDMDNRTIAEMEDVVAATPTVDVVPPPMSCHPAYTDRAAWLQEWLSRRGPYAERNEMFLPPRPVRAQFVLDFEIGPSEPSRPPVVLARRLCSGLAPYVGQPFAYFWFAIKDDYGRTVAGESWIERKPS